MVTILLQYGCGNESLLDCNKKYGRIKICDPTLKTLYFLTSLYS